MAQNLPESGTGATISGINPRFISLRAKMAPSLFLTAETGMFLNVALGKLV
jgi:hypothetical protein